MVDLISDLSKYMNKKFSGYKMIYPSNSIFSSSFSYSLPDISDIK